MSVKPNAFRIDVTEGDKTLSICLFTLVDEIYILRLFEIVLKHFIVVKSLQIFWEVVPPYAWGYELPANLHPYP